MPYGYPATQIDWVALSPAQGEPIPGESISLTHYSDPVTGGRVHVMPGATGFDAPPIQLFYDELTGLDGALFRHARASAREVFIPVVMWADSRPAFLELKRTFLARLNPLRGPGRLVVTEGDNTGRYLDCYYESGAEGSYAVEEGGFFYQKYGLIFRCLDPFWYSSQAVTIEWSSGSSGLKKFFGDEGEPFFGLRLNPSHQIDGETPVTSVGEVDTWPVWTITGPVDGLTFAASGASSGSFHLNVVLGPGDVLYVDTRPSRRRILKLTNPPIIEGLNYWPALRPGDVFWPLKPGLSNITISAGSAGAETSISMTYRPRYYSA